MHRRFILSLVCIALLLLGCTPTAELSSTEWPTIDWRTSTPAEQGMDAALLDQMLAHIDATELNLHSLLVIRHGAIVLEKYYPGLDQQDRHQQYSITKSFVATLFGIALDQGKFSGVDQPVSDFFPGSSFQNPDPLKDAMTLEDLLSMRSGLDWNESDATNGAMYRATDWLDYVMDLKMETAPVRNFNYCTGCSHVLLKAVEQATGADAEEFARKYLFEPIGIRDFSWERTPHGDAIGGWGLNLTTRDMAKLGYLYLHDGAWDGQQIVSRSWVQAATRQHADPDGRMGYGYQWWLYDTHGAYAALGHAGQTIFVIPDLDIVLVTTAGIPNHDPIFALIDDYILPSVQP